ncbi:MAG TPA: hypothetical protein DCE43_23790 [Planctomycetaceae bacterium]|nr:hypothetical protein [Planctomycetaceae bacterium]
MATPVQIIKEFIKKSGCFLYGIFIVVIGFRAIFEPTHTEFVFFLSMILVACMGGGRLLGISHFSERNLESETGRHQRFGRHPGQRVGRGGQPA